MNRLAALAWRESRTARRRLLLYMSSISLGAAALVAIDSFASNVERSVREQSRALLGGDVTFGSRRPFTEQQQALLDSFRIRNRAEFARVVTFPSMALVPRSGGTRLVQVRAVTANYPFYGTITTRPSGLWPQLTRGANALVDPSLLVALDARVGDTLALGYARFTIMGVLENVPGTPGVAELIAPRVFIPEPYVAETQLLVFGSTAQYEVLARLPDGRDPQGAVRPFRNRLRIAQVRVQTVTENQEMATDAISNLGNFIGIVGLIALLLGGVGVASGVRAFVARKIDTVAIMRCLGASSAQILWIYVTQAGAMGLIGALAGAALGVLVQLAIPYAIADFLPVDVNVTLEPTAILLGIAIGGWIALIFSLRPLLALRGVSPLQTLRRDADSEVLRMRWTDLPRMALDVALVVSVVAIAVLRSADLHQGLWIAAGIMGAIVALTLAAASLSALARKTLRSRWPYVVRQGVANLYRPANQTRAVTLSLGFGAFLVTTVFLVQSNLLRRFDIGAMQARSNLVFFDVQEDQSAELQRIIRNTGGQIVDVVPIVTMRISAINGMPADRMIDTTRLAQGPGSQAPPRNAGPEAQNDSSERDGGQRRRPSGWALRREYRSTYRSAPAASERIVAGRWFSGAALTSRNAPAEVSLEQDIAEELRVELGDTITWDVQGVPVQTRVTSLRDVTWERFEPNFFAVFSPPALQEAPKQVVVLTSAQGAGTVARLQRHVVSRFPNVSSIDLSLVRETIAKIVRRVTTAIRFLAFFSLAMAIPVLFSAVAATKRDRIRESVLLKTLGATKGQITRILLAEYALLGLLGSLTGMLLALGGGWALMKFIFEDTFAPAWTAALGIAATALALTIAIGLLAGRNVFRETPMSALRQT